MLMTDILKSLVIEANPLMHTDDVDRLVQKYYQFLEGKVDEVICGA